MIFILIKFLELPVSEQKEWKCKIKWRILPDRLSSVFLQPCFWFCCNENDWIMFCPGSKQKTKAQRVNVKQILHNKSRNGLCVFLFLRVKTCPQLIYGGVLVRVRNFLCNFVDALYRFSTLKEFICLSQTFHCLFVICTLKPVQHFL